MNRWGILGEFIGSRDMSDHCPICIIMDGENWGPKPFKVNNESFIPFMQKELMEIEWFLNKSFIPFIEKEWMEIKVKGRGDFVLKEKICILKDRL